MGSSTPSWGPSRRRGDRRGGARQQPVPRDRVLRWGLARPGPSVAQAFGARRIDECHRWLVAGVWLGLSSRCRAVVVVLLMNAALSGGDFQPRRCAGAALPLRARVEPAAASRDVAFRRYLQREHRPSVMFALISANSSCDRELDADLREPGRARAGRQGRRIRDRRGAHLRWRASCSWSSCCTSAREAEAARDAKASTCRGCAASWRSPPAAGQMVSRWACSPRPRRSPPRVGDVARRAPGRAQRAALTFMVPFGISSAARGPRGPGDRTARSEGASIAGWTADRDWRAVHGGGGRGVLSIPRLLIAWFTTDAP